MMINGRIIFVKDKFIVNILLKYNYLISTYFDYCACNILIFYRRFKYPFIDI
jgi:hypothetical protein